MQQVQNVYPLSDAALRRTLLRSGHVTPASFLFTVICVLAVGILGRAPLWPLAAIATVLTLLHFKALRHFSEVIERRQGLEVLLENDRVVLRRKGLLESTIARAEVTRILEVPGNCLWLQTENVQKFMSIPTLVTGYPELKSRLATWTPIQHQRGIPGWMYLGWYTAFAVYFSILLARSPYVFFPMMAVGTFYLLPLVWLSIKSWVRDGWNWTTRIKTIEVRGQEVTVFADPFWVPAIPVVMLGALVSKAFWIS
jgi:hypothetical protein